MRDSFGEEGRLVCCVSTMSFEGVCCVLLVLCYVPRFCDFGDDVWY
jgi:hypothetical protein